MPTARDKLDKLTTLIEIVLYSNFEPDEEMADRAEKLAGAIKQTGG